jgi:hypothetical protein
MSIVSSRNAFSSQGVTDTDKKYEPKARAIPRGIVRGPRIEVFIEVLMPHVVPLECYYSEAFYGYNKKL